jgi:hypothetical protein
MSEAIQGSQESDRGPAGQNPSLGEAVNSGAGTQGQNSEPNEAQADNRRYLEKGIVCSINC